MNLRFKVLAILSLAVAVVGINQAAAQYPYVSQGDGRTHFVTAAPMQAVGAAPQAAMGGRYDLNMPAQPNWASPAMHNSLGGGQACDASGCHCGANWEGCAGSCWSCPGSFRRPGSSYLAFDGSWTFRITPSSRTTGSGAVFGGGGTGRARMSNGSGLGARIGYNINPSWRTDVSYQFFESPYRWTATFANAQPSTFNTDIKSHIILWNTYVHPCQGLATYDPYIGGGIGVAVNEIGNAREMFTGGGGALVKGDSYIDLAGRVTAGVLIPVTERAQIDFSCNVTYIGKARTNNTRNVNGAVQPIRPYVFDDNFIGAINLGLILTL